jgi:molecular chaperone GrpE (heat shock protein)
MNDGLPPRWHEASKTLTTLLTWLEETGQWVETTAATVPQTESAGTTAAAFASEVSPEEAEGISPDLYTLLAALTALRQEVKMQTRSARHDREQTAQALEQVSQTVVQLDAMRQADRQHYEATLQEAERAIAEALVEVHDAFSRATREAERIVAEVAAGLRQGSVWRRPGPDSVPETPPGRAPAAPAASPPAGQLGVFSWLRTRFTRPARVAETRSPGVEAEVQQCRSAAGPMADRLEGLAEGYTLSLERLERLLATYGIAPIACLGHPVDAALMEVVQIVVDPSQPPGTVLGEVRRGYRRHGRVLRFAQVVATRARLPADATPPTAAGERQEEA